MRHIKSAVDWISEHKKPLQIGLTTVVEAAMSSSVADMLLALYNGDDSDQDIRLQSFMITLPFTLLASWGFANAAFSTPQPPPHEHHENEEEISESNASIGTTAEAKSLSSRCHKALGNIGHDSLDFVVIVVPFFSLAYGSILDLSWNMLNFVGTYTIASNVLSITCGGIDAYANYRLHHFHAHAPESRKVLWKKLKDSFPIYHTHSWTELFQNLKTRIHAFGVAMGIWVGHFGGGYISAKMPFDLWKIGGYYQKGPAFLLGGGVCGWEGHTEVSCMLQRALPNYVGSQTSEEPRNKFVKIVAQAITWLGALTDAGPNALGLIQLANEASKWIFKYNLITDLDANYRRAFIIFTMVFIGYTNGKGYVDTCYNAGLARMNELYDRISCCPKSGVKTPLLGGGSRRIGIKVDYANNKAAFMGNLSPSTSTSSLSSSRSGFRREGSEMASFSTSNLPAPPVLQ